MGVYSCSYRCTNVEEKVMERIGAAACGRMPCAMAAMESDHGRCSTPDPPQDAVTEGYF